MEVIIRNPGDDAEFEKAVKIFKKIVQKSGILEEVKERRYFEKPSVIKHRLMKTIRPNKDK
jgi:ribosomal protein S21